MVYGLVDIDMIAGPSEILVLADDTCNPRYVAADLLVQAEHDKLASAVLISDSADLARRLRRSWNGSCRCCRAGRLRGLPLIQTVKSSWLKACSRRWKSANLIAPEHLELCVDDPFALLHRVKNAGSVFLGKYAPEALGDYYGGPQPYAADQPGPRVSARPCLWTTFVKKSSYIYYTHDALSKVKRRHCGLCRAAKGWRRARQIRSAPDLRSSLMSRFLHPDYRALEPYVPGEQPKERKFIKLNTNESPFPPRRSVQEVLSGGSADRSAAVFRPDRWSSLQPPLRRISACRPGQVFAGNGSDDVLAFCIMGFCGRGGKLACPDITYGFYPVYASLFGAQLTQIPLREDFTV